MTRKKLSEGRRRRSGRSGPIEPPSRRGESIAGALTSGERLLLRDWCAARATAVDDASIERLGTYRELLFDWNARMNLTSIRGPREILVKHFLDSLAILPWLPEGARILDIGTGAGFPGMVVKLVRLAWPVTLVEATGKKVGFLEHVRRVFRLEGCDILHRRLEGGEADLQGRFAVVVSRGVESPGGLVRRAAGYLEPGGRIIAMSGRTAPSAGLQSGDIERSSACRLERIDRFDLPEEAGARHLLLFQCGEPNVPRGT